MGSTPRAGPPPAKKQRLDNTASGTHFASHTNTRDSQTGANQGTASGTHQKRHGSQQMSSTNTDHFQGKFSLKQKAQSLLIGRKNLPIWKHADSIRKDLRSTSTLLVVGETGSGKSTQIPQFLITEQWCQRRKVSIENETSDKTGPSKAPQKKTEIGGCIAITQPRRVAAISLARRVAEEMGTTLGKSSPASKVGYSVRFDNNTSPCTRIKFVTEGMLLQEMLRDPWLKQYSAIIVDEVHERDVNVDLVLGFLKMMSEGDKKGRGGVDLKVVIMSATADMESLQHFFEPSPKTPPAAEEDGNRAQVSDSGRASDDRVSASTTKATDENHEVAIRHIEGRQFPVNLIYAPSPVPDIVEAALIHVFEINHTQPLPGDILVFLTGQSTVESLVALVEEYATGLSREVPKILPLPLFAALPQAQQQQVFRPAPHRTRKVIISTNIAETSVTVPGVRFVVDCGKSKVKQFRTRLGLESLLVKPISKSAAVQRAGRAGREAAGTCYRMYTQPDFETMEQATQPEILRSDLAHTILTLKARGVEDLASFPFLTPPTRDALGNALLQLYWLDALNDDGHITPLGHAMAKLPLSAPMSRALLAAAEPESGCLAEMIDVISALSVENVFIPLTVEEAREKAETARRSLMKREGDHLTLLAVVRSYLEENSDRKRWCAARYISHRAMQSVMDVRKQLLALGPELEALTAGIAANQDNNSNEQDGKHNKAQEDPTVLQISTSPDPKVLLRAILKGFPLNTAVLVPDGSYRTTARNQTVAIHPSSVLFGRKVEAIVYSEYVYTTKSFAKNVSAVEARWLVENLK